MGWKSNLSSNKGGADEWGRFVGEMDQECTCDERFRHWYSQSISREAVPFFGDGGKFSPIRVALIPASRVVSIPLSADPLRPVNPGRVVLPATIELLSS